MKTYFSAVLPLSGVILGFSFFSFHFETQMQKRGLASVQNNYDLSCLQGKDFEKAYKKKIVSGIKSFRKEGLLGLEIGHFIFSTEVKKNSLDCISRKDRSISSAALNDSSSLKLACRDYPVITFSFSAEDQATNGEKRQFEVQAECQVKIDLSKTETIWIPWQKISQETPFDGEAQFTQPSKLSVKTTNVSQQWPKKWALDSIELKGKKGSLKVDREEIRSIAGRPLVFDFP
jgi:hypothetical protein